MESNKLQFLYELNNRKNYGNKYTNDADFAEFISKNINSMTFEEMKCVVLKCLNYGDLKRIMLEYELKNLNPKPIGMNLNKFGRDAAKILKKYQCKGGGFLFGKDEWKMHNFMSKKYNIGKNKIYFENFIHIDFLFDFETISYLHNIVRILNLISSNVVVSCHKKFLNRDKNFCIILKCVHDEKGNDVKQ